MSRKNEWPAEQLALAVELWTSDLSTNEIAERLGTSVGALHGKTGRRRDLFPSRRGSFTVWTSERLDRAVALWNAGLSKEAIAAQLGVTRRAFAHIAEDKKYRDLFTRRLPARRPQQAKRQPVPLEQWSVPWLEQLSEQQAQPEEQEPPQQQERGPEEQEPPQQERGPEQQENTPQPEPQKQEVAATPARPAATKPVIGCAPLHRCQFILSAESPWKFCGDPVHPEKPYCTKHCRICYVKPSDYSQARANQERELARVFGTKQAA